MRNTNNATAISYVNVDRRDRSNVDAGIVNVHLHSLRTSLTRRAILPIIGVHHAPQMLAGSKPGYLRNGEEGSFTAEQSCFQQTRCFASGSQRTWRGRMSSCLRATACVEQAAMRPEVSADSRSII